jgi:hypothetical protein
MDGFWRPTRLSAVKRSEGANENGLISPCRKLVAVMTFITPVRRNRKHYLRAIRADEANAATSYGQLAGAAPSL